MVHAGRSDFGDRNSRSDFGDRDSRSDFFNPTGQRVPLIVILGVIFLTPLASVYHRSRF